MKNKTDYALICKVRDGVSIGYVDYPMNYELTRCLR